MTLGVMNLIEAAAKFNSMRHEIDEIGPAIIAKACEMVCAEAKRVLGTYDYEWTQLSPETLKNKMANTPLLETGELRESISWNSHGLEGWVGSDDDKAVWQELGTPNATHPIPPRSFLVGAAQHTQDKIHALAARAVVAVLSGGALHGPEMRELLHILKHTAERAKETFKKLVDEEDEKDTRR